MANYIRSTRLTPNSFLQKLVSDICVLLLFCLQVWFTAPTFFFFLYYVNLSLYHVLLYELLVAVLSLTLNRFVSCLK